MIARCLKPAAKLSVFAATALVISLATAQAQSCSRAGLPASAAQVVPTNNLNQSLFNQAVLSEVNFARCKAGLSPVQLAAGLMDVADKHANWMARKGTLSHRSTVRGQTSVQERVLASGLNVRRGSENIGNLPRYQFGGSRKIFVKNSARCEFTTTSGRQISPHSYATLASEIVGMWMDSSGHRKNVLDRNATAIGSALGYDASASFCGQYFLSQNFAG